MRILSIISLSLATACAAPSKGGKDTAFAGGQKEAPAEAAPKKKDKKPVTAQDAGGDAADDATAADDGSETSAAAARDSDAGAQDGEPTPSDADASDPSGGEGGGTETGATDADGGSDDGKDADGGPSTGSRYFEATIVPLFTAQCASCHADPRMNPPQRGPLTIFSYVNMRVMLEDGGSASDNRLSRKVRNVDLHGGGNRCSAGPTGTPCKEMMEWWRLEFGADSGFDGRVSSVSVSGDVFGYAVDTRDEKLTVTARLFVDGKLSIETPASVAGADGNYAGDHAFRVVLPAAARDGKEHTLQLYAGDVPLGAPVKYTAYAPKDAGRAYFTSTVAPALNGRCGSCHVVQYEVQYGALLAPAPSKGGTATANTLIDYAAGGNGHPGGNVCGGKNGSPCSLFQTWWNMEFGP
jgi:hypothetical protein